MNRLLRFQGKVAARAGAALITSPQNQYYLSRFSFTDGMLLVFADAAYLLTDFRYAEAARAKADRGFEVICPKDGMMAAVGDLLSRRGVDTLLLEEGDVSIATHARLRAAMPCVELLAGAGELLSQMRAVKDAEELAAMRGAQELTDAAFSHILDYLAPSVREVDVALELELFMRRNGADGVAFDTIAVSGAASALPHGVPRDIPLEKGFLTMDFGARLGGYCSDRTRTVVIGRADEEMKRLYATVLRAQDEALSMLHAGVSCRAADAAARDVIEGAGYHGAFGHSLGHGVGIDIHEAPNLSPKAPEGLLLLPGHVVTVEPGIYLEGKYGCRIEDMVAVGEDGSIYNFTHSTKELLEIV